MELDRDLANTTQRSGRQTLQRHDFRALYVDLDDVEEAGKRAEDILETTTVDGNVLDCVRSKGTLVERQDATRLVVIGEVQPDGSGAASHGAVSDRVVQLHAQGWDKGRVRFDSVISPVCSTPKTSRKAAAICADVDNANSRRQAPFQQRVPSGVPVYRYKWPTERPSTL